MRAASLLGVLIFAKILGLAGRELTLTPWSPLAFFWQDLAVVIGYAALDAAVRRPSFGWGLYAIAAFWAALNVPIVRLLSTPLTWTMMRAARGTLADSIAYHITAANLALIGSVLLVAAVLPWSLARLRAVPGDLTVLASVGVFLAGPMAGARTDTAGLDRNAVATLVLSAFPRLSPVSDLQDWRASPFESRKAPILQEYSGAAPQRNVLLIVLESTGAAYLCPYGAREDPMPRLTALAGHSILFENAYAVYPESIKGLFSLLCSRYPALDTSAEKYGDVSCGSLAHALREKGYATALFHSGRFSYLGMESVIRNRGFDVLEDAGHVGGNFNSSFGVDEPSTVRRILAWIDQRPRDRFFVTYLPVAGHHPYATPEPGPFPEDTELGRYHNALRYSDAALGSLIDGLRARGLDQNTLVVVAGDHGEAFGQHDGNYGHTLQIYEENVRVPLLFAVPGVVDRQVRESSVASLIDVSPTILDLLGVPPPAGFQGNSLLGVRGAVALFYTDYSLAYLGLRDGCWKYVHELDAGRSRLFNLCQDPLERNDLSAGSGVKVGAYREHVTRWAAAQRKLLE